MIQPVLFAIQIALTELWQSWGITPDAVVGHSMGEVASALYCRYTEFGRCNTGYMLSQSAIEAIAWKG